MPRIVLGFAVANMTVLLASFALGFFATGEARGPSEFWHVVHFRLGLASVVFTLLVHSIVFTYFLGTGKWVKEVARVYRLPDWVSAQADKNKRKAFPFVFWGMALIGGTAWLGAGSDALGWDPVWHLGLAALTLTFTLGAFGAEYVAVASQARLVLEVKDQADRLRAARYGTEPVAPTAEAALRDREPQLDPTRSLGPG